MIPVLYDSAETSFTSNGLGRLSDLTRCVATEERNGIYELEMDMPMNGAHYSEIQEGMIVTALHDDTGKAQPFIIYKRSAPLDGLVTFYAHHISYKLSDIVLQPFTAASCAAAIAAIPTKAVSSCPFTFWTDKSVTGNFSLTVPRSIRSVLGGEQGSLLDTYGKGEYEFDGFGVKLWLNRGSDKGVTIRYGKNLTDLTQEVDASGLYNAIVPYWADANGENVVTLSSFGWYVTDAQPGEEIRALVYDLSDEFDEAPGEAMLQTRARQILASSDGMVPKENITVSFTPLWQTTEFEQFASLQRVALCDKVTIIYEALGVSSKAEVIRTVYDCLLERYDEIELGEPRKSLAQVVREATEAAILPTMATKSALEAAVDAATELITGGYGGYVVIGRNADGQPNELLIMDTPDKSTAVNVWRWNSGGLGHSSNGYDGPYNDVALTADGKINASMITTGVLDADVIRAGVITDAAGKNTWDLDGSSLTITDGTININTSSATQDKIQLNYSTVNSQLSPTRLLLTNAGSTVYAQHSRSHSLYVASAASSSVGPLSLAFTGTSGGSSVTYATYGPGGLQLNDSTGAAAVALDNTCGTIYEMNTAQQSIPQGTWTDTSWLNLDAGTYIIYGSARISEDGVAMTIAIDQPDTLNFRGSVIGKSGVAMAANTMTIVKLDATTEVNLKVWTSSAVEVYNLYLRAIKLFG